MTAVATVATVAEAGAESGVSIGVVTFPGTLDDRDAARAVRLAGAKPVNLWHADSTLAGVDGVILPGGFSYGDYLRCGAIAGFAPIMEAVVSAANAGMPVLGICNGFQILCESHLLPGALIRNDHQHFICRDQELVVENTNTAWTGDYTQGQIIRIPLKNGEGGFVATDEVLDELEGTGRGGLPYPGLNPHRSERH
ncbi:MAG: phosphoribosylformylglycinamidine synthase subunit PurQ, partial [Brevibacterium aurantiacum]|nr:phosphoribosylformylglycinamidine synthase subunit PurQ [Brevibacterium aurantiacum]